MSRLETTIRLNALDALVLNAFAFLDRVRCRILRVTLQAPALRSVYVSRAKRLDYICGISTCVSFVLAVFLPYTMLLLNPILLGLPHLVASLRYASHAAKHADSRHSDSSVRFAAKVFGACYLFIAAIRYWNKTHAIDTGLLSEISAHNQLELGLSIICILVLCTKLKLSPGRSLLVTAGFMPVVLISWISPILIIGGLHIAHNFVAFMYWRHAAYAGGRRDEIKIANHGLLLFSLLHVMIFTGIFDFAFSWQAAFDNYPQYPWLTAIDVGESVAPWVRHFAGHVPWDIWCRRLMLAYVFGQGLHYTIWLRCVAEQNLNRTIPVTFRQTLGLLKKDFGSRLAVAILLALTAYVGFWLVTTQDLARLIYICFGSLHGYVEIVGFLFLTRLATGKSARSTASNYDNTVLA